MTVYINLATGEYPVYAHAIRNANPRVSFNTEIDDDLAAFLGFRVVNSVERPVGDVVTEGAPDLVDGVYKQTWVVRSYTDEEKVTALDSAKANALASIASVTRMALKDGVSFDFGSDEEPDIGYVALEEGDRVNVIGLKQAADRAIANSSTAPMFIRCVDDSIKAMTPQKCIDMSWAVYDGYTAIMGASWQLQATVNAAASVDEIPEIPTKLI